MTPRPGPLSLAAGSVLDAGPGGTVRAAAAAGFPAAGVRLDRDAAAPDRVRALRRMADDLGVDVLDVEVARIGPADDGGEHLRLAAAAAELGARFLLTVSEHPDPAATADRVARLCDAVRGSRTAVAVEFMAFTAIPTLASADALAPADAVVLVDALHLARSGGAPADLDGVRPGRVGYAQLCDAPAAAPPDLAAEARHRRCAPGRGELPLGELLDRLPHGVPLSVEVQSDELRARLAPVPRARHLLRETRAVLARSGSAAAGGPPAPQRPD